MTFKNTKEKIQRVSVKGILCRDNKVLLLQDQRGKWELPGGRIDFGETPEETLKREFKEELNIINVSMGDIVNIWTFSSSTELVDYHFIILVFEVLAEGIEIKLNEESTKYGWFNKDELMTLLDLREGYKESINKFYNNYKLCQI